MEQLSGGCHCRRVRFTAQVEPDKAYACHSQTCRKTAGGAWLPLVSAKMSRIDWQGKPDWYQYSPIAHRAFCCQCGTPLGIAFVDDFDNLDLTVGSFDEPERFRPAMNRSVETMLSAWTNLDSLPGQRSEDNSDLMRRLEDAGLVPQP